MKNMKGQVALEFLMYAGLFMIIAIAAYALTTFTERGDIGIRESQLVNAFGYKFAYAPTVAYKGGEGFTYDITFPSELDSRPYDVTYICTQENDLRSCTAYISWAGSYQNYTYPYVIAPAYYGRGTVLESCLKEPALNTEERQAIALDPSKTGHLIFRNIGIRAGDKYPTIELYCSAGGLP